MRLGWAAVGQPGAGASASIPISPHPEVISRARLGMAKGTGHLWGQVKEARVGSARDMNGDEYSCTRVQAGCSTRAGAEMWSPSPGMSFRTAPPGCITAFPAVRPQSAWWPHITGGLVHSSQTTRVTEDMAEPAPAVRAPNVSCWKSPALVFYLDNEKHKVW